MQMDYIVSQAVSFKCYTSICNQIIHWMSYRSVFFVSLLKSYKFTQSLSHEFAALSSESEQNTTYRRQLRKQSIYIKYFQFQFKFKYLSCLKYFSLNKKILLMHFVAENLKTIAKQCHVIHCLLETNSMFSLRQTGTYLWCPRTMSYSERQKYPFYMCAGDSAAKPASFSSGAYFPLFS